MTFVLLVVHLGAAVAWLGAMAYSLVVVQPRIARAVPDPTRAEEIYRELAAGNRWPVVGMLGGLALTGAGLVWLAGGRSSAWWAAIVAKALLWLAAAGLFWWVSWRGWPRRVFALPEELPAQQARFRRVALALTALVGLAFALGVVASHLPL
jgi:Flp pilus assembly protein TadB